MMLQDALTTEYTMAMLVKQHIKERGGKVIEVVNLLLPDAVIEDTFLPMRIKQILRGQE